MTHMLICSCERQLKSYLLNIDKNIEETCRNFLTRRNNKNPNDIFIEDPVGLLFWKDLWDHAARITDDTLLSEAFTNVAKSAADSSIIDARNACAHGNKQFKVHYWYSLAALVTSDDFLKLNFSEVQNNLIKAENGHINENINLETWNNYFEKTQTNLPEPDYLRTGFIGRSKELKKAKDTVMGGRDNTFAVCGPGGTGKTAFVIRLLKDIAVEGTFDNIFFFSLKTEYLSGDGVQKNEASKGLEDLKEAYRYWNLENDFNGNISSQNVCMCFDNIETIIEDSFSFDKIFEFIDELPKDWKVIFTSRINVPNCRIITLKSLDAASSKRLTIEYSKAVGGERLLQLINPQIDQLINDLSGNPLSIKVAIDVINTTENVSSSISKTKTMISNFSFDNLFELLQDSAVIVLEYMRQAGWVSADDIETSLGLLKQDVSQVLRTIQDTSLVDRKFDEDRDIYLYTTTELSRGFLTGGGINSEIRKKVSEIRLRQNDESVINNLNSHVFRYHDHYLTAPDALPPNLANIIVTAGSILKIAINTKNKIPHDIKKISYLISEWNSKASTSFKNNYYFHLVLGRLLFELSDPQAEMEIKQAVTLGDEAESLKSKFVLARFYMAENRLEEAKCIYETILKQIPTSYDAIMGLSLSLQFTNSVSNLLECIKKIVEFDSKTPEKKTGTLLIGAIRRLAQHQSFVIPDEILELGIEAANHMHASRPQSQNAMKHITDFLDALLIYRSRNSSKEFPTKLANISAQIIAQCHQSGQHFDFYSNVLGKDSTSDLLTKIINEFSEFSVEMFEIDVEKSNSNLYEFDASSQDLDERIDKGDLLVAKVKRLPAKGRFCFAEGVGDREEFFVPLINNAGDSWHTDLIIEGVTIALRPETGKGAHRSAGEWYFLKNF